jgi:hypothetical protein
MAADGSPQNFPLPRTNSILPLLKGNQWVYSTTVYNTQGEPMDPYVGIRQVLDIPEVYGLRGDGTLTPIGYAHRDSSYLRFDYAYEVDDRGAGYLVTYRIDLPVRGVYVTGGYEGNRTFLYDSTRLWLAYPASPGDTYSLCLDSVRNDTNVSHMEVVSTSEPYYFPDSLSSGPSPLRFVKCYLYRETIGDTVCYYYYSETYGALGYRKYQGGVLRMTYQLRAFVQPNQYYDYRY